MEDKDVVKQAMLEIEAEREEKEKKIGCLTVAGAFFLGMFPIIGLIYGVYLLTKGRTEKGALFIAFAIGWFVLALLTLGSY